MAVYIQVTWKLGQVTKTYSILHHGQINNCLKSATAVFEILCIQNDTVTKAHANGICSKTSMPSTPPLYGGNIQEQFMVYATPSCIRNVWLGQKSKMCFLTLKVPRKKFCCLLITLANSLDQVQAQLKVGHDLDPNCLTLWWISRKKFLKKFILKKNQLTVTNIKIAQHAKSVRQISLSDW